MNDELRQKTSLFRYGILAPLISETLGGIHHQLTTGSDMRRYERAH